MLIFPRLSLGDGRAAGVGFGTEKPAPHATASMDRASFKGSRKFKHKNGIRVWTISITNQRVTIHYNNCIGAFEVPDRRKLPERDILLETGKGVTLSYAPAQIAI